MTAKPLPAHARRQIERLEKLLEAEREAGTLDADPPAREVLGQRHIRSGVVSLLPTGLVHSMDADEDAA